MNNSRAYTLTELLVCSVLVVLIFGCTLGTYVLTKRIYSDCVVSANLQRDIAVVAMKIIRGIHDDAGIYGLTAAKSYHLQSPTEIHFVGTDNFERRIFLFGAPASSIVYAGRNGNTAIYTAPANSSLSLLFMNPGITAGILGTETVNFKIDVLESVLGRNASASLQTYVNVRNR